MKNYSGISCRFVDEEWNLTALVEVAIYSQNNYYLWFVEEEGILFLSKEFSYFNIGVCCALVRFMGSNFELYWGAIQA